MKSVRLSLFLFFMVLLALALGGLSYFSYHTARLALQAKEHSTGALFALGYRENCRKVNMEFDQELIERARSLRSKLDSRAVWVRNQIEPLYVLGLINGNLQQHGHLQVWLWLAQSFQPGMILRLRVPEFHIEPADGGEPPLLEDEYYQINTRRRPLARSENLTFWLPVDDDLRRKASGEGYLDTVTTSDGKVLRRVTMSLVNIGRVQDGLIIPLRPLGTPGKNPPAGAGPRANILFQYARETTDHDAMLAKLEASHERDLAVLQESVNNDLAALRTNLMWIGGGAFLALSCGGFIVLRAAPSAAGETR